MSVPSFGELKAMLGSTPEPTVDRFLVHSRQELVALSEHAERAEPPPPWLGAPPLFGIPIHIDESVPPGVMRAMLGDEVVGEHTVR